MAERQSIKLKDPQSQKELANAKAYFGANSLLVTPPVKRAAYSDRMAWILASMSHLVYDRFEDGGRAKALLEKKLDGGGFKWVKGFSSAETGTQAFLVSKDDKSYAVLAFRGTEKNWRDIQTDIHARRIKTPTGKIHVGFKNAFASIEPEIKKSLLGLEGIPLYITGHSLGGALATVATQILEWDSRFTDQIAACYTFGSPRVGNDEYDSSIKSMFYRVVNTTDIVTIVPLLLMGFVHVGDVRFLLRNKGEFKRSIPISRRLGFFLGATLLQFFRPLVQDHGILEYRKKLEAVAQDRNIKLFLESGTTEK
ncbi:MAG TPA: lipase family protein [Anaerolineales bacterium]|nr:lipase family protein [Anaerolineales bacterium]